MEEKTKAKRKGIHVAIYLLLSILIILSLIYIINFFSLKQEAKEQTKLLSVIDIYEKERTEEIVENASEDRQENDEAQSEERGETISTENPEEQNKETERMLQVKQLQEQNADIVGWLEIENTNINQDIIALFIGIGNPSKDPLSYSSNRDNTIREDIESTRLACRFSYIDSTGDS